MADDSPSFGDAQKGFGLDSALLLAYVACVAIVLAMLPLGGGIVWGEVGAALGLQAGVGVLLLIGPRLRGRRRRVLAVLGVIAYLGSVALLRDGTSPTAGYGPLVLVPVAWASLRGRRAELTVAIVGVAAVYLVPNALIGPPQYPVGNWRAGVFFIALSAVIGVTVYRLVGHMEKLSSQLDNLARSDELTGLPNRRAWRDLLQREIATARRTGQPFTIALLDLDLFKHYNDSHGHLAGDRLLVSAAAAWRNSLRGTDVLARWGGDEFALLLPNCSARQTEALLDRIRVACPEAPFSAGFAESDGEVDPETLLAMADEALYRAKRAEAGPRRGQLSVVTAGNSG